MSMIIGVFIGAFIGALGVIIWVYREIAEWWSRT